MQFTTLTLAIAGIFTAAVQAAPTVLATELRTPPEGSGFVKVADGLWFRNETDTSHYSMKPADPKGDTTPLPKYLSNCRDDFYYENRVTHGSPWVKDCWVMYNNIQGDGLWWGEIGHRKIATYGTCAYGIEADNKGGIIQIGNDDVRLTIKKSIEQFAFAFPGEEEKISALGKLACETYVIDWYIYNNY
ncbi:putative necrosis-inducing factor-domain-containing protein [Apiosordaria backusii]|uniref:Necrosis-inducing factor-domain-containing protein n=1 Tax=Apiosordaria backusii TaxID=314023 RepID=A0AA40AIR6_9PEZI|nr:putative necrosis-inducing factor-domain-containing protein [Apiosordaria backusii]